MCTRIRLHNKSIKAKTKAMETSSKLLEQIYRSALKFLQPTVLKERYRIAVKEAVRLVDADHGSIFLEKDGNLIRAYTNVPNAMKVQPRKNGYTYRTFTEAKIQVIKIDDEFNKVHPRFRKGGARSLVLIPLTFRKRSIGVLTLQSHKEKHFTSVKINTLNLFGSVLGLVIVNSQLFEEAQEALRSRELFISLASHELKTPLTTVMAYADQIGKRLSVGQIPNAGSFEIMRSEMKRLKNMLDEFLALDQIKSGQLRYIWGRVSILDVVKRSAINFKLSYPGYKVFIENKIPANDRIIIADKEKLQQVFTNLLNNSAKFSTKLTPIVLTLEDSGNFIAVSIADYGKGIKKKEQNKIFMEFFKGSAISKDGMGIGLYLVKNIIAEHKGKISLSSKLNKGTTVTLSLPKKRHVS